MSTDIDAATLRWTKAKQALSKAKHRAEKSPGHFANQLVAAAQTEFDLACAARARARERNAS